MIFSVVVLVTTTDHDAILVITTELNSKIATDKAVVLFPDIFGYELPNNRAICDLLAAHHIHVIMPDFFDGNGWKGEI